jgi:hypothetical protein
MQLGGSTKELYYYPSGTALITVVDENANPGASPAPLFLILAEF